MKKMNWTKYMVLAALTFLLVLILASCQENAKQPGEKPSAGKLEDAASKPVELTVFIGTKGYSYEEFMKSWGGDFVQKKYPNLTFKLLADSQVETFLLEGKKIDLVQVQRASIQRLMLGPQLQSDISDLIKKYNVDLTKIEPAIMEEMKDLGEVTMGKGAILGMPVSTQLNVLYYNKDLFNKFGVNYPTSGMTWDQVLELSNKMSRVENGVNYMGFFAFARHYHLLNQYSQGYIDPGTGKATLNNDTWQTIFRTFASFYQHSANPYEPAKWTNIFWKEGRMAMMVRFFSPADANLTNTSINWDLVELPNLTQRPGVGSGMLNYYFNVASTSEHREQAFLFAATLASEEYQQERARSGNTPVVKSGAEIQRTFGQDSPLLAGKNTKALLISKPAASYRFQPNQGLVDPILDKAFDAVALKQKDVNTALRDAEEEANKKIAEANAEKK